ncbi:helix-turn-helix domain-containing protein [Arcobacter sp. FWKO B]|nr:bacteriophage CI repressor [Arcobacter sp. FWKO B]
MNGGLRKLWYKTDKELVDKLGVSRHTVSAWNERKSLPKKI